MGARILVVEDEAIVAENLRRDLESMGHSVAATAMDGDEAVDAAEKERPDLILMDIRLAGGSDGIEAARRILSRHSIPVIFTTAYSDASTLRRATITVPYGYLVKPIEERDLRTAVEIALYRHRMEGELVRRVKLESFIGDAASLLLSARGGNARAAIEKVLEGAARFARVDRAMLVLFTAEETVVGSVYEWYEEDLYPLETEYSGLHANALPWLLSRIKEGEPVCLKNIADLPKGAEREKELWTRQRLESLIAAPVLLHSLPGGWLAFGTVGRQRLWLGEDLRLARIVAQDFAGLLTRIQAEGAVAESEEKFRTLVEHLREVIFSVDGNGYFTYLGANVEPISGYAPDELMGEHFTRFVHPHDREALLLDWKRTVSGMVGSFDFRILTKSGDVRWVRTSNRPVFAGSFLTGFTGIMMDMSQQRRAEQTLVETEDRYHKLWQLSSDGLVLIDAATGEMLDCNDEFCRQTGRSRKDLLGMRIWEIRPAQFREAARAKFMEISSAGTGGSSELSFERPDGSRCEVDFVSTVIRLAGKPVIQSRCRSSRNAGSARSPE